MTHDEIIRLAEKAGLRKGQHWNREAMTTHSMTRFAKLIADAKRDEIAERVDALIAEYPGEEGLRARDFVDTVRAK